MNGLGIEEMSGSPLPLSGSTRVYAILGDPIAQVASPRLFNSAFRRRGAEAVLVPLHVVPSDLAAVFAAFRSSRNFDGLIITVPHKVAALGLVDEVGAMGARIGAINVIRKQDGLLLGDNFDGIGFVRGLRQRGHELAGRRVLIVGSGGAGRAVAHAVLDEKPAAIRLFDVDHPRAEDVAGELRRVSGNIAIDFGEPDPTSFDVAVNCTSMGMKPDDPFPLFVDRLSSSTLVVDIILKPDVTPLLAEAARRGCATHVGIHMLQGQVEAVCDFFGIGA